MSTSADLLMKAELAEKVERYEDMAKFMKAYTEKEGYQLQPGQGRQLFIAAYKNVIEAKRSVWRVISSEEQKLEGSSKKQLATEYRAAIEEEIGNICGELIELLSNIIENASDAESKIFFCKMAGDYNCILVEVTEDKLQAKEDLKKEAKKFYEQSVKTIQECFPVTDPIRLGAVLDLAVFYYEIMGDSEEACKLAKTEHDKAFLGTFELENNHESTNLMILRLSDKLCLWEPGYKDDQCDSDNSEH